ARERVARARQQSAGGTRWKVSVSSRWRSLRWCPAISSSSARVGSSRSTVPSRTRSAVEQEQQEASQHHAIEHEGQEADALEQVHEEGDGENAGDEGQRRA